jgi:hypothetical protein
MHPRLLNRSRGLAAVLCAVAAAACATGKRAEEPGPPTPTLPGGERVYAPTGPGQQLEPVVDPEFHMAAARRDFQAGLGSSAVREIEKLGAFMGHQADRSSGERRRAIEDSKQELAQLARAVAHGDVKSVDELDRAFAHARAALVR